MGQVWDPAYLKRRLEHCRKLASAAIHPDVKNAHLGNVRHYEQLLETVNVRGCRA
jgi:hypothetical protein